jgi:cell division protein FtsN
MKNKDYVSKKKPPANSSKQKNKAPFPVIKLLLLLALIAVFAYFLMYLKGDDLLKNPLEKLTEKPVAEKSKAKPKTELPPIPEDEEWQFIEELENKEVQVDSEELQDKGPWRLRCATVRSEERAEGLKAQIAFAGYESTVKAYQGTSGLWYRVDLGPFERKREAQSVSHDLKRNKIFGCKIFLWN